MPKPVLLAADKDQNIFDVPGYLACGQAGDAVRALLPQELIPLPKDSKLFFLPDRSPVAINERTGKFEILKEFNAVAAFISPGHTQLLTAAYEEHAGAKLLPLFSYTPVAYFKRSFYIPAIKVDTRNNHNISCVDWKQVDQAIRAFSKTDNRLIRHLAGCAKTNFCPNAINFFLGKLECPLPTSPECNAQCLGCISKQPKDSCPETQPRLTFRPTAQEVAEIALIHIKKAKRPVVSFGQGCEGEPLLAAKVIEAAIRLIRSKTSRGTIHMNTNGSRTADVIALCDAGLDSLRVSLNSCQKDLYHRYYLPKGYSFTDVKQSILEAKKRGKFVALNYLTMPGFTDREDEFKSLVKFISSTKVDMIQWRNLNYDPLAFFRKMKPPSKAKILGINTVIQRLKNKFPKLCHGYFNIPL